MRGKITAACLLFLWFSPSFAVSGADVPKQTVRTISSGDMLHWGIGLLIVLGIFFLCVWSMRKLSGITVYGAEKMRIIGSLSLGVRERVILLQIGKKQLVLGVTPGRIDALHVLEGDDCLNTTAGMQEASPSAGIDNGFAQKLMQAMKGRSDG